MPSTTESTLQVSFFRHAVGFVMIVAFKFVTEKIEYYNLIGNQKHVTKFRIYHFDIQAHSSSDLDSKMSFFRSLFGLYVMISFQLILYGKNIMSWTQSESIGI
jgi:hypothetical protein